MALEFMTGAVFFAALNFIFALVFIYLGYRIFRAALKQRVVAAEIGAACFLLLLFFSFSSVTQAKLSIELPQNRELLEYQQDKEIRIETPPPRTEELKGFEALQ